MEAKARFELGLDLDGFDMNSGDGLDEQEACDRLASALETLIAENPRDCFTLDIEPSGAEARLTAARCLRLAGGTTRPFTLWRHG